MRILDRFLEGGRLGFGTKAASRGSLKADELASVSSGELAQASMTMLEDDGNTNPRLN